MMTTPDAEDMAVTHYYFNDRWQVVVETDEEGLWLRKFVYGNGIDEPLIMVDGDITSGEPKYYYIQDHLSSTVALLDEAGEVAERYEYDAYGRPTVWVRNQSQAALDSPLGYYEALADAWFSEQPMFTTEGETITNYDLRVENQGKGIVHADFADYADKQPYFNTKKAKFTKGTAGEIPVGWAMPMPVKNSFSSETSPKPSDDNAEGKLFDQHGHGPSYEFKEASAPSAVSVGNGDLPLLRLVVLDPNSVSLVPDESGFRAEAAQDPNSITTGKAEKLLIEGGLISSFDYPVNPVILSNMAVNSSEMVVSATGSAIGNPYWFTGRRVDVLDGGAKLVQINRHRYYDYETGRWLSADPLGVTPGDYMNGFNPLGQYADGGNCLYGYQEIWRNIWFQI